MGTAECGPASPVSGETTAARLNWAAPSSADPAPELPPVACMARATALGRTVPIDRVSTMNPTVTGASERVPAGERVTTTTRNTIATTMPTTPVPMSFSGANLPTSRAPARFDTRMPSALTVKAIA